MSKNCCFSKSNSIIEAVSATISANFGFILLFWMLSSWTMVVKLARDGKGDMMIGFCLSGMLLSVLVAFVTEKLFVPAATKVIRCIISCIMFVAFVMEAFVVYQYNALLGVGTINSILETNPEESAEFFKTFVGGEGVLLALVIVLAVWALVKYRPWRKAAIEESSKGPLTKILMGLSVFYFLYLCIAYPSYMYGNRLTPITRMLEASSVAWDNHKAYQELQAQLNVNINLTRNDSKITNIVFILGESTNRNHMHLYGYDVPNTPNLDELSKKGEIVFFKNVVSAHSTTVASLSKIFTFCNHEAENPWYKYHNLIDVMNEAGYKTHWLSNQESSGIWGNVAQIYAAHSKVSHFTQIRDSKEDEGRVDGELFPLVDDAIGQVGDSSKNFFVVHLMGGHLAYYNRYPYEFAKFKAADISSGKTTDQKDVIAQYDNALFYNDYIVSGIIDKFREMNSDTIVIYLPDHGEAVYDEGGVNGHVEENPSRHMIEVPLIMWASEKFKQNHPEKWERIQASVNNPYMTDDMIHTVLDIADIGTPDYDSARSIINVDFNALRPRFFDEKNYDTDILGGNE